MHFPLHQVDMSSDLDRFQLICEIGRGEFSVCQKAVDNLTGQLVAFKTHRPERSDAVIRFQRQIEILKELQQPFSGNEDPKLWNEEVLNTPPKDLFLQLIAHSGPNDTIKWITTELANQSLKGFLKRQAVSLSTHDVQNIGRSILKATAALHYKSLVHLDIKPSNLMLFGDAWKLIDVEGCICCGRLFDSQCSAFSPIYCAPEFARAYLAYKPIVANTLMDVWSVGMTLAEVATLSAPLKSVYASLVQFRMSENEACKTLLKLLARTSSPPKIEIADSCPEELHDLLLHRFLVPDLQRQELAESLQHEFFKDSASLQCAMPDHAARNERPEIEWRPVVSECDAVMEVKGKQELRPGDKVQIRWLQNAVHLNGQSAILESFIDSSQRWRVQLEDGGEKDVKPQNIVLQDSPEGKTPEASASSIVTATFSVLCETSLGEEIRVVGNLATLGQWDPSDAPEMRWTDGHIWVTTVEVEFPLAASGTPLEYKYVVMSNGHVKSWESCENRILSQPRAGFSLACHDVWGDLSAGLITNLSLHDNEKQICQAGEQERPIFVTFCKATAFMSPVTGA